MVQKYSGKGGGIAIGRNTSTCTTLLIIIITVHGVSLPMGNCTYM